jgi:chromosome segregation ATPase
VGRIEFAYRIYKHRQVIDLQRRRLVARQEEIQALADELAAKTIELEAKTTELADINIQLAASVKEETNLRALVQGSRRNVEAAERTIRDKSAWNVGLREANGAVRREMVSHESVLERQDNAITMQTKEIMTLREANADLLRRLHGEAGQNGGMTPVNEGDMDLDSPVSFPCFPVPCRPLSLQL